MNWVPPWSGVNIMIIEFWGFCGLPKGKVLWHMVYLALIWVIWLSRNCKIIKINGGSSPGSLIFWSRKLLFVGKLVLPLYLGFYIFFCSALVDSFFRTSTALISGFVHFLWFLFSRFIFWNPLNLMLYWSLTCWSKKRMLEVQAEWIKKEVRDIWTGNIMTGCPFWQGQKFSSLIGSWLLCILDYILYILVLVLCELV